MLSKKSERCTKTNCVSLTQTEIDMPFDVFEHHKLFLFDELNDTAKEAAIMEYRYDFQDFDFLMYNDWFFNFSEDE